MEVARFFGQHILDLSFYEQLIGRNLNFRIEDETFKKIKNTKGATNQKPFAMICMPSGTGDGLLVTRLSDLEKVVSGLQENWEKERKQNGLDQE